MIANIYNSLPGYLYISISTYTNIPHSTNHVINLSALDKGNIWRRRRRRDSGQVGSDSDSWKDLLDRLRLSPAKAKVEYQTSVSSRNE